MCIVVTLVNFGHFEVMRFSGLNFSYLNKIYSHSNSIGLNVRPVLARTISFQPLYTSIDEFRH